MHLCFNMANTCFHNKLSHCSIVKCKNLFMTFRFLSFFLTMVSASMNTHLLYCVSVQQCSLVNVTPKSGLFISARWAASPESIRFTTHTSSKMDWSASLQKNIKALHPYSVFLMLALSKSVETAIPARFCNVRSYENHQFPGCAVVP